ncbi:C-type lectin domain family 2 member B-like [Pelodiscus sinensis]|uniref:C-type lectin domain family 2 member B-like n=1 Tax=Pelodiscus sinensis TaxID=13735 RepID=UPI003F6AA224
MESAGSHCNCKTHKTVALGVAAVVIFGLLMAVIALAVLSGRSPAAWGPCCPDTWVGYQGKCYYFSKTEGNWPDSWSNCSALGASLAGIDTPQEMFFMQHSKGKFDHWIGLWRHPDQPWKWANGTEFNHWFVIQGGGDCAFLNDENGVGSSRCTSEAQWICSKPDVFTAAKETPGGEAS